MIMMTIVVMGAVRVDKDKGMVTEGYNRDCSERYVEVSVTPAGSVTSNPCNCNVYLNLASSKVSLSFLCQFDH